MVIDELKSSIEKRVDWTAEDAGGQNIAEASAQIRSLEKLQSLHESRSMSQQLIIANMETLSQKLREDLSTKTAESERLATELVEATTSLTEETAKVEALFKEKTTLFAESSQTIAELRAKNAELEAQVTELDEKTTN